MQPPEHLPHLNKSPCWSPNPLQLGTLQARQQTCLWPGYAGTNLGTRLEVFWLPMHGWSWRTAAALCSRNSAGSSCSWGATLCPPGFCSSPRLPRWYFHHRSVGPFRPPPPFPSLSHAVISIQFAHLMKYGSCSPGEYTSKASQPRFLERPADDRLSNRPSDASVLEEPLHGSLPINTS